MRGVLGGRTRSLRRGVPLPYARSNEIRFEELVGLIPPLSYSLPRWDDLFNLARTQPVYVARGGPWPGYTSAAARVRASQSVQQAQVVHPE